MDQRNDMNYYNMGRIPMYFNMLPIPHNPEGISDLCEMKLCNGIGGAFQQVYDMQIADELARAYKLGSNIAGLMDNFGIGNKYALDFFEYITKIVDIEGKSILEIGCGSGYLLSLFKDKAKKVLGIEPGEYGKIGSEKFGIPIMNEFFQEGLINEQYDIVIFFGVLEHIENPKQFMKSVKRITKNDGHIFCAVPNCEPYIEIGDMSCLLVEHYSYFTKQSLDRFMKIIGLNSETVKSNFGGSLYSHCTPSGVLCDSNVEIEDNQILENYYNNIQKNKKRFENFINNSKGKIGIYCPVRLVNYISQIENIDYGRISFYDDDSTFYGLYYPGINIKMKNFDELVIEPVDTMIIASLTFGDEIKNKVKPIVNNVVLITEIFSESSDIV